MARVTNDPNPHFLPLGKPMKPYLIRLDDEDTRNRHYLVERYEQLHGRRLPFADILRLLMKEKVAFLREQERMAKALH